METWLTKCGFTRNIAAGEGKWTFSFKRMGGKKEKTPISKMRKEEIPDHAEIQEITDWKKEEEDRH